MTTEKGQISNTKKATNTDEKSDISKTKKTLKKTGKNAKKAKKFNKILLKRSKTLNEEKILLNANEERYRVNNVPDKSSSQSHNDDSSNKTIKNSDKTKNFQIKINYDYTEDSSYEIKRRHEIEKIKTEKKNILRETASIKFLTMLILIISFFFVELIFGALYDFLVLVADAMHMLTDAIALVIGLYAFIKSKKVRTDKATFGFVRMEVVGGLVNGCFLMVIAFDIFREAITLLLKNEVNKDLVENSGVLLIIGGIGLGVNIIGLIVFGFDHGHGHSDDNSEKKKNFNIQAVFLHVLGDALGSVAVIVSCLVIRYSTWERRTIIDPICSMIISVIIFATSIPVVRGTVRVLLEKVPTTVDLYLLKRKLLAIDGIKNIHELHVWQLNSNKTLATCHVILDKSKNFKRLNDDIQKVFHGCGVHSTTIQPEFQSGSKDCFDIVCGSTRCIEELCCEKIESDD